jgi:hypothetical protein
MKIRNSILFVFKGALVWSASSSTAFTPGRRPVIIRSHFSSTSTSEACSTVVVISPPGGVGEVAAVKASELGSSVRWFVVSGDADNFRSEDIILSQEALDKIASAGGSVEVAGATSSSLLIPSDQSGSSVSSVSAWCGRADAIICAVDGIVDNRKKKDEEDPTIAWTNAIKIAANEAVKSITGSRIAIISSDENNDFEDEKQQDNELNIGNLVGSLVRSRQMEIPKSVADALGSSNCIRLRHGQLFGIPESSPDFSPFVGGPRRQPELCEEYENASVRVDSTIAVSGNRMTGNRSSRHSVGQAAALLATGKIETSAFDKLDVCISSQPGSEQSTLDEWKAEFERVQKMMAAGEAALLFEMEFASVPNQERLADWLATKWAPAVLRTYEIAAITRGARPVKVNRLTGETKGLEVIWQQLVNFEPVLAGKMIIQVSDTGIQAIRGAGDPKGGFGAVSNKPLGGEDVLVRRLAEAASQAVEKGLAIRVSP